MNSIIYYNLCNFKNKIRISKNKEVKIDNKARGKIKIMKILEIVQIVFGVVLNIVQIIEIKSMRKK